MKKLLWKLFKKIIFYSNVVCKNLTYSLTRAKPQGHVVSGITIHIQCLLNNLESAYCGPMPIPALVHKGLISSCKCESIPDTYHGFYMSLTPKKFKSKLHLINNQGDNIDNSDEDEDQWFSALCVSNFLCAICIFLTLFHYNLHKYNNKSSCYL